MKQPKLNIMVRFWLTNDGLCGDHGTFGWVENYWMFNVHSLRWLSHKDHRSLDAIGGCYR